MANVVDVNVVDNAELFLKALPEQIEAGLIAIGITAEANSKTEVDRAVYDTPESPNYVRTGRLRNSLTHAVDKDEKAVYIGTNVEYAAFVELGTTKMAPRPYLKPAATEYTDDYKRLMEEALKA